MSSYEEDREREVNEDLWRSFVAEQRRFLGQFHPTVAPPMTREQTVKEAWRIARPDFDRLNIGGRLEVIHDLGVVEPILFERICYDETWVIEAEGVIVERLQRK